MDISFSNKKLQKNCNSKKESVKKWGVPISNRIGQRLAELHAADTLADMSRLPPTRCHELEGTRKGQFSVDVSQNYRLIFEPDCNPIPKKEDGGIYLRKVSEIRILAVEDYHGE